MGNVHVLYILDTNDPALKSVASDVSNRLNEEVNHIANALSVSQTTHKVMGKELSSYRIRETIEKLEISPLEDIIILCILAHGSNVSNKGRYPTIRLSNTDKRYVQDIIDLALLHQPAYLLSIVLTCNANGMVTLEDSKQLHRSDVENFKIGKPKASFYQTLFAPRKFPLAITYLSAQQGEVTKFTDTEIVPFSAFMFSLKYWTSDTHSESPSWDKIMFTAQSLSTYSGHCPYLEIANIHILPDSSIQYTGEGLELCK